ncbi:pseudouridine synthase [Pseudobythopirellula maris]|uniref:pseudouridine synthase n=1 Tax=Pseudobythopirellula maris TaxID=2527991 RepID=UPI0018D40514|nr:pseudouridine synthase [Pseudobythopirellula maris]
MIQPPREDGERLQKVLAAAGIASRRECEEFIQEGRVTVDGVVVSELGARVDPFKQQIMFDGEALPRARKRYFALNKPEGVVCTARDPSGRPRVTDLLPPEIGRVFNVGRLDMASEGLILLTNDGELANRLTHPRYEVEKVYHVQVAGVPTQETLAELRRGVYLAEGKAHFVDAKVKGRKKNGSILELVLDEGRNREIRRVLARVGHKVQRLTRVAVGAVKLGQLPKGAYRELTPEEIKSLRSDRGGKKAESKEDEGRKAGRGRAPKRKSAAEKPAAAPKKAAPRPGSAAAGPRVIGGDDAPAEEKKTSRPKKAGFKKKVGPTKQQLAEKAGKKTAGLRAAAKKAAAKKEAAKKAKGKKAVKKSNAKNSAKGGRKR